MSADVPADTWEERMAVRAALRRVVAEAEQATRPFTVTDERPAGVFDVVEVNADTVVRYDPRPGSGENIISRAEHAKGTIMQGQENPETPARVEFGLQHHGGEVLGPVPRPPKIYSPGIVLHRRVVRTFDDGSVLTGPWRPVPDGESGTGRF